MERSRSERLARWWLRRDQRPWVVVLMVAIAVASIAFVFVSESLLKAAFHVMMACVFLEAATIAFERRQYGLIIGRLEAEVADLRGEGARA